MFGDLSQPGTDSAKNMYRINTMDVWAIKASKSQHWIFLASFKFCLAILKNTSTSQRLP